MIRALAALTLLAGCTAPVVAPPRSGPIHAIACVDGSSLVLDLTAQRFLWVSATGARQVTGALGPGRTLISACIGPRGGQERSA